MKIAVFSTKTYDRHFLVAAAEERHDLRFIEARLSAETVLLAAGHQAVCAFVNDTLNAPILEALALSGVRLIAMRCAGYNNVDLPAAGRLGLTVVRVPAYSPYAVAEHTVGLILALNRKLHRAFNRVREGNFALEGLLGFDLHGKTVGVIGLGRIGQVFAKIMTGFGCTVLCYDPFTTSFPEGTTATPLHDLYHRSDIISLHCPLTKENHHLIGSESLAQMKPGVMLINTSRGGLLDTREVIKALKSGKVSALGLDVYEEEEDLFFEDRSSRVIPDDVFSRLLTFPNVLITGHQAFFTQEAMENIAGTTMRNIAEWETTGKCENAVR